MGVASGALKVKHGEVTRGVLDLPASRVAGVV